MKRKRHSRKSIRPGPGWGCINSVWQHTSGVRVHIGGMMCGRATETGGCRDIIAGGVYPMVTDVRRYIAMAGGNKRRGVMVWALHEMGER